MFTPGALCSTGPCLQAHMRSCHIRVGFGILQALIGTRGNEFSSNDLSRICGPGKVATPSHFMLWKISSLCNHGEAPLQWSHILSNSTIYYLIAIIYSDRITMQNMHFFPPLHFTFDDSLLWILSYQRIWDAENEMNMTIVNYNQTLFVPILCFIKDQLSNCKIQLFSAFSLPVKCSSQYENSIILIL